MLQRAPLGLIANQWHRVTRRLSLILLLAGAAAMSGCLSVRPKPAPTPPPPTASPTAVVIFPTLVPTATWTPPPTPSPASDLVVGLGDPIYVDDFRADRGWQLGEDALGATSIFQGELVIAVRQPNTARFALSPTDPLTDFYLEVTARAEICGPEDEFGLIFRSRGMDEHYRFSLTCAGQSRVVRFLPGTAAALVPFTDTYLALPGASTENRLAVMASGGIFRFLINGMEAFTARDPLLSSGRVGVFVRAGASGQTTVSFDDFSVRALLPAPTPSATATRTPRP